ncbi:MAG: hypothetical protein ACPHID_06220 [Thermoplasmatota archaeon]
MEEAILLRQCITMVDRDDASPVADGLHGRAEKLQGALLGKGVTDNGF